MERARRAAIAAALILGAAVAPRPRSVPCSDSWHATGDDAVIELRALDVGGRHTPLDRAVLAVRVEPSRARRSSTRSRRSLRLFGERDVGMLAGAVVLNALALGCIVVVLWRRRDTAALVLGLLVTLVLVRAVGGQALLDPWNPYVIVLPAARRGGLRVDRGRGQAVVARRDRRARELRRADAHRRGAGRGRDRAVRVRVGAGRRVPARGASAPAPLRLTIAIAAGAGVVVWLPPVVQAAHVERRQPARHLGLLDRVAHRQRASRRAPGSSARSSRSRRRGWARTRGSRSAARSTPSANRFPVALILLARRDRSSRHGGATATRSCCARSRCALAARDLDRGVAPRRPPVRVPAAVGVGRGRGRRGSRCCGPRGACFPNGCEPVHAIAAHGRRGRRVRARGRRRRERGARVRTRRTSSRRRSITCAGRRSTAMRDAPAPVLRRRRRRRCARRASRPASCSTPGARGVDGARPAVVRATASATATHAAARGDDHPVRRERRRGPRRVARCRSTGCSSATTA